MWIWQEDRLTAHVRAPEGGYEAVERSALLPECDLALLGELSMRDQNEALEALVAALA